MAERKVLQLEQILPSTVCKPKHTQQLEFLNVHQGGLMYFKDALSQMYSSFPCLHHSVSLHLSSPSVFPQ